MKSSELIALSTFQSTADAQIAKGILDEAGIESVIRPRYAGGSIQRLRELICSSGPKMLKRAPKRSPSPRR